MVSPGLGAESQAGDLVAVEHGFHTQSCHAVG